MAKRTLTKTNLVIIPPKMEISLKSNIRDVKKNIRTGRTVTTSVNNESYRCKKSDSKKKILLTRKTKKSKK